MVFNTATVGAAVTPAVIQTFITHYLNRKPLAQKPTAHISYDEGINLIRKFLLYASHNTVEDIQRFTSQWVPHPRWVKVDEVIISEEYIKKAAEAVTEQLGHHGIEKVGGRTWWQWRRPGSTLKAEWIEMKVDYHERKKTKDPGKRVMLYVHGGAYFFGSVDEHRYQMQRHARKLKARVFARMLVILRDRGIPLPAGAILISPWVDLTHSFPSVSAENPLDYIPPHGFHQRPSASWPPPTSDDMLQMEEAIVKNLAHKGKGTFPQESEEDAVQGFHVDHNPPHGMQNDTATTGTAANDETRPAATIVPGSGHELSIMIDGNLVEIKDQIQMYASNQLISHPLVSPILQPSLGGLPPLLILTGGGEMLRDEQIYLAHKAANPAKYAPGEAFLDDAPHDHNRNQVNRWKPTDVQLQVWDDLCHVAPTLSFTRPAKYMYRSIAQFGAWALARAQKTEIDILDDDDVSIISKSPSDDEDDAEEEQKLNSLPPTPRGPKVGKAGDPLPPFKHHMIRQRVDRHGIISPLEHENDLVACNIPASEVGVIKEGPVRKWMAAKKQWDTKFSSSKRKVQKQRAKEMAVGYQQFGDGEVPPPSALAGRRTGKEVKEEKKTKSMGMSLWALWGSKHDEKTTQREQQADKEPDMAVASSADGANARPLHDLKTKQGKQMDAPIRDYSRSRSRRRTVTDEHQTEADDVDENTPASVLHSKMAKKNGEYNNEPLVPDFVAQDSSMPAILVRSPTVERDESELKRPKAGGIAFPFSLKQDAETASMMTLTSDRGVQPLEDLYAEGAKVSGVDPRIKKNGSEDREQPALASEDGEPSKSPTTMNGHSEGRPPMERFVTAKEEAPSTS